MYFPFKSHLFGLKFGLVLKVQPVPFGCLIRENMHNYYIEYLQSYKKGMYMYREMSNVFLSLPQVDISDSQRLPNRHGSNV